MIRVLVISFFQDSFCFLIMGICVWMSDPVELELQVVVTWVGAELRSFVKAVRALNCISPALPSYLIFS